MAGFLLRLLRQWNLDHKFLAFFAIALTCSLLLAFWAIQRVATRLVLETTRQASRDAANTHLLVQHLQTLRLVEAENSSKLQEYFRRQFSTLGHSQELLRPQGSGEYLSLEGRISSSPSENQLLDRLAKQVDQWIAKKLAEEAARSGATTGGDQSSDSDLARNAASDMEGIKEPPGLPVPFSLKDPGQDEYVFAEAAPGDGKYYYYHPVVFVGRCLDCHGALRSGTETAGSDKASERPFRVLRMAVPYRRTQVWTLWSYSIMIAIGIAVLGITLFAAHWILKKLVMRPLEHLREVSDQIAQGSTELRATIDTEDEFRTLSDAFNTMVRHMTDAEAQLQQVNQRLELKVDDLAQANLQLYEANRLKSEFLANMSHELRTPLNSILGFSEVLQGVEALTEKQRRYAGNIQQSGRLLLDMINDILDLAKMEAGKMQVRPQFIRLNEVVGGPVDFARPLADKKNIDLQLHCKVDLEVYQDGGKIQQIVNNLLSNAVKFTPEGGLIQVVVDSNDEERFFVSVSDTGVGIAESDFDIIFQKFRQGRFQQSEDGLARSHTGTGLGLSIVQELCKLLHGEVMLHSQLGKGSTFVVDLPRHYEVVNPVTDSGPESFDAVDAIDQQQ
jgi:signal transduction histidine kinase